MPEYPEVYTIVNDLNRELSNLVIDNIQIIDPSLAKPNKGSITNLINRRIYRVSQAGKNIVLDFLQNDSLVFHLRMTGRILLRSRGFKSDPYAKIIFFIGDKELRFCEVRKFGYAQYLSPQETASLKNRMTNSIKDITKELFKKNIKSKNILIKRALLDQDLVSGIGNIYANEGLFVAKIHPEKQTKKLTDFELEDLFNSLNQVVDEGILHRGSTLPDESYVDIYGKKGEHQNYFRVYGRKDLPCLICKTKIKEVRISQRSTFFCPNCQKLEYDFKETIPFKL